VNEGLTHDEPNAWRRETPGPRGWPRTAHPGDPNKYFMVSADCHANEPHDYLSARIEPEYRARLPRVEVDARGERWLVTEGWRPQRLRTTNAENTMAPEDKVRAAAGAAAADRVRDHERDGVEIEIVFPGKGLIIWATPDPKFAMAMCRAWNRWAREAYGGYEQRILPMAAIGPADREGTLAEIAWAAKQGFRGLTLPCKPYWGAYDAEQPNYNLPDFDWLWAAVCDVDLPVTFHVSTGRDPRAARGHGGAIINYVTHSLSPTMEPVANLCASGVLERFPQLRFATIEAGIGWVPWALEAMDEAYRKHHMWAFPKLDLLPSEYYRRQGFSSFQEDATGLALAEPLDLADNFLWANDYPHHEGSWPHSAAAIERQMSRLSDESRAKILGLNAARLFRIEVPRRG
jgi:predicted TIM-barrel fold metal-dependent hydrolase